MDFGGRWALRAAASMPVQIIRGSGARHQGSPPPSRPQHVEQVAPLGHSPTHPPTHPSHVPSVGLVQNLHGAGLPCPNHWTHGMGRPNPPHGRGVSKSVLTWAGSSRAGVFVQNLLDMDGESKSSSRAGRLAQILLDMDFLCDAATPSRHHHMQQPAPLAHYPTCPPTPSIMASHVPSPNHVTHLLPREFEATYPGGATEGRGSCIFYRIWFTPGFLILKMDPSGARVIGNTPL